MFLLVLNTTGLDDFLGHQMNTFFYSFIYKKKKKIVHRKEITKREI